MHRSPSFYIGYARPTRLRDESRAEFRGTPPTLTAPSLYRVQDSHVVSADRASRLNGCVFLSGIPSKSGQFSTYRTSCICGSPRTSIPHAAIHDHHPVSFVLDRFLPISPSYASGKEIPFARKRSSRRMAISLAGYLLAPDS